MPLDLVTRRVRKLTHQVGDGAVVQVPDAAAAAADKVMVVMRARRQPVVKAPVVQEHAANDAQLSEQAHRAEDSCPARPSAAVQQIVNCEVALLLKDRRYHGPPRRSYAISARFEFQGESFEV